MISRDHFIFFNGQDATLKKLTFEGVNQYDEVDYNLSTYDETAIKVLMNPNQNLVADRRPEGVAHDYKDVWATVEGSVNIAEKDLLVVNSVTYAVIEVHKIEYKGTSVKRVLLRWERKA